MYCYCPYNWSTVCKGTPIRLWHTLKNVQTDSPGTKITASPVMITPWSADSSPSSTLNKCFCNINFGQLSNGNSLGVSTASGEYTRDSFTKEKLPEPSTKFEIVYGLVPLGQGETFDEQTRVPEYRYTVPPRAY